MHECKTDFNKIGSKKITTSGNNKKDIFFYFIIVMHFLKCELIYLMTLQKQSIEK